MQQTTFKIEKNKPMPERAFKTAFPLDKMEVGDSFFVPLRHDKDTIARLQSSISGKTRDWSLRSKNDSKFATRVEGKGVRVWRIK